MSQLETRSQRTWLPGPTFAAQWLTSAQLTSQPAPQANVQSLARSQESWQFSSHVPLQLEVSLQS
jgi:hypothetical protein